MVFDINRKIHMKSDTREIDKYLRTNFDKYKLVRLVKTKYIYFKGKPSLILRFSNEKGCVFSYFNLSVENHRKEVLGSNSEVFRITMNRIK